ncbi:hypothetical protein QM042_02395 [Escherichia coli]|uniref:hypothetical protein n=1 Tax=Escherichia coli TaxID=562 RepID=UPI003987F1B4
MALTMTGLEIEKTSGYWRAKGFRKPDMLERLEREDGYIIHWHPVSCAVDPETGKLTSNVKKHGESIKQVH